MSLLGMRHPFPPSPALQALCIHLHLCTPLSSSISFSPSSLNSSSPILPFYQSMTITLINQYWRPIIRRMNYGTVDGYSHVTGRFYIMFRPFSWRHYAQRLVMKSFQCEAEEEDTLPSLKALHCCFSPTDKEWGVKEMNRPLGDAKQIP